MNPKSFDINAPSRVNPSATSRPVIVGHRPVMTDPMMRPPLPTATSITQTPLVAPAAVHVTKVIAVSDELKNDLAASQAQSPAIYTPPTLQSQLETPTSEASQTPLAATVPTGFPAQPPVNPVAAPPPAPEPDLSHMPHVPITHVHNHQGKLKTTILWALIISFLLAFTSYLLIDSGLISSSINLPVHIFNKT